MACCLASAKPLTKPMLECCWLDPQGQTSVKSYLQLIHFHSRKCIWKCCLENGSHFVSVSMCQYDHNRRNMFNIFPWITCIYCQWWLPSLNFLFSKIRRWDMLLCEHKQFIPCIHFINSLWPSDTIWWQRSGSTLAQVMACCLSAPSHYLNQCWLIISEAQWHPD